MKKAIKIIGLILISIGLIWAILNRFSCRLLCNLCSYQDLAPCYFLFLFVGIVLIISGTSLILTGEEWKKKKTRKKMIIKKKSKKHPKLIITPLKLNVTTF